MRVAPFGYPRIKRLLAATRGFSQQRYVLHRLLVPRHPPCALSSLTFLSSLFSDRDADKSAPDHRDCSAVIDVALGRDELDCARRDFSVEDARRRFAAEQTHLHVHLACVVRIHS